MSIEFVVIKGRKYLVQKQTLQKGNHVTTLVEYDKEKYDELVNSLIDRLEKSINKRDLLRMALGRVEVSELEKIEKALRVKKAKPKSKLGCYELEIGRGKNTHYITLVD